MNYRLLESFSGCASIQATVPSLTSVNNSRAKITSSTHVPLLQNLFLSFSLPLVHFEATYGRVFHLYNSHFLHFLKIVTSLFREFLNKY
jgi:hypothetical protein